MESYVKELCIIFIILQEELGFKNFSSAYWKFKLCLIARAIALFQTETDSPVFLKSISGLKKDDLVKNE